MMREKVRIVVSGVGNRALPKVPARSNWSGWVDLISKSEGFELSAVHDPSVESLKRIVERGYIEQKDTYTDLDQMLSNTQCDAILVSSPAEYHARTMQKALDHNLHIIVEKPFVTEIEEGKKIVEAIKAKGLISCSVQNWRYKDVGRAIFNALKEDLLGPIGHIFFQYVRNREDPNYPAYIFEEPYPLLYAMGIHHLDLFRYILEDEIFSITGHAFKPPWSMYKSETGVNLFIRTEGGIPIIYTGSISSKNSGLFQESLLIEGEKGALVNVSQWMEPPLWFYPAGSKERIDLTAAVTSCATREQYDISDKYILDKFYKSIVFGEEEICPARSGLMSICAVEASRMACETGDTILVSQLFN
ncbi:MAG: Gfo/Idh/MocA family oxidoreductase [Deltaproteobacteria bacterium]|nr:Gfo/Idh/MocA family oxidoreductase [Deltaproteobacteria bacterium]